MYTVLATKTDLAGQQLLFKEQLACVHAGMRAELAAGLGSVRAKMAGRRQQMRQPRSSPVLQLGSGLAVGLGLLFAALKLT
jgi:hypothetical protein